MSVERTVTKQMLIQQTEWGDATVRTVAGLANVSIAEVIREAVAHGLPRLLEDYGLTEQQVAEERSARFPLVREKTGGIRVGNARPRRLGPKSQS